MGWGGRERCVCRQGCLTFTWYLSLYLVPEPWAPTCTMRAALVVLRKGAVATARCLSEMGEPADVHAEKVHAYLQRARALQTPHGGGSGSGDGGGGGGGGGGGSDSGGSGDDEACELCGRTYPHEHIRNAYRGGGGDSSGSDAEGRP